MSVFFGSIWWLAVSIGVLVTFHEFGHFIVARLCGVHVVRFSVGFGPSLFKRVGKDGTEYVVAAIPLGGYVKMLDEREYEVDPADAHRAHNRKPVWQRMAIAAAGPAANFLLCFVLFWAMFVVGQPDYQPVVGHVSGLAAKGGFQSGDRLVRIGDEPVGTWTDASVLLATAAMRRQQVRVEVALGDGGTAVRSLPLQDLASGFDDSEALGDIGLFPKQFEGPAVIGEVQAPNALHDGDRVLSVNGAKVDSFGDLRRKVGESARENVPLRLAIVREGKPMDLDVVPRWIDGSGSPRFLGLGVKPHDFTVHYDGLRRYGPVEALGASAREMRRQATATFGMLKRIFTEGAVQGLSGPVGIAQVASAAARDGLAWFLFFLGVLSLSLGMLNLLPVPILDGGHLLYYLMELVKGSPVSERSLAIGQYIGVALLAGLMCVAFYNDLLRHAS